MYDEVCSDFTTWSLLLQSFFYKIRRRSLGIVYALTKFTAMFLKNVITDHKIYEQNK